MTEDDTRPSDTEPEGETHQYSITGRALSREEQEVLNRALRASGNLVHKAATDPQPIDSTSELIAKANEKVGEAQSCQKTKKALR